MCFQLGQWRLWAGCCDACVRARAHVAGCLCLAVSGCLSVWLAGCLCACALGGEGGGTHLVPCICETFWLHTRARTHTHTHTYISWGTGLRRIGSCHVSLSGCRPPTLLLVPCLFVCVCMCVQVLMCAYVLLCLSLTVLLSRAHAAADVDTCVLTSVHAYAYTRAGALHTGILTAEGKMFTWGSGEEGRLGHGKVVSFRRVHVFAECVEREQETVMRECACVREREREKGREGE